MFRSEVCVAHSCQVSKELALKMYSEMVTLQVMDTIFFEAQRQGRISFYLTSHGEEAINIASAAALTIDDIVLPQVYISYSKTWMIKLAMLLTSNLLSFSWLETMELNAVQGTWCSSMARLHTARICKSVLWE